MQRKSEIFGEIMKQKSIENYEKQPTSKRRNTGSKTLLYLHEKTVSEMAIQSKRSN